MRDFLFRGKTIDTYQIVGGQWLEGSLIYIRNDKETICKITDTCLSGADGMLIGYDVDPETVCQYTGVKDKNGKKIFEGDIVKAIYKPKDEDLTTDNFVIKWDEYYCKFVGYYTNKENVYNPLLFGNQNSFEVIGNIFDDIEAKITLEMTVNVYTKESGLDAEEIKQNIADFARGILVNGANTQEIALALQKVESDGVSWTRQ